MAKKYGFIAPTITSDHWVLGAIGSLSRVILQEDADWSKYLPDDEFQSRPNKGLETTNCTAFGSVNAVETIIFRTLAKRTNYSDRWVGINAGTKFPYGNDPHVVAESIRKTGLIPEDLLPFDDKINTVEEYYSFKNADEKECRKAAAEWLQEYEFGHEWVFSLENPIDEKINNMKIALKYSPLCASVYAWAMGPDQMYIDLGADNHWVLIYGYTDKAWKVFDTYDQTHKLYDMGSNIMYCKRYHIAKKEVQEQKVNAVLMLLANFVPQTKEQLNALIKLIITFLAPQEEKSQDKQQMPLPTKTNREKLFEKAQSLVGQKIAVNSVLGCAETVNKIFEMVFGVPIGGTDSTYRMYPFLKDPKRFTEVVSPLPGDIIISPTGYGSGAMAHGHVGFIGNNNKILSNSSSDGRLRDFYTLTSWKALYVDKGRFPMKYYRVNENKMGSRKFGVMSSSVDPEKLSATVSGAILMVASLIIIGGKKLGFDITQNQIADFASQIGAAIGTLWVLYGIVRKAVVATHSIFKK